MSRVAYRYRQFNELNGILNTALVSEFARGNNVKSLMELVVLTLDCKDTISYISKFVNKDILSDLDKSRYNTSVRQAKPILDMCSKHFRQFVMTLRTEPYKDLVASAGAYAGNCVNEIEKYENGDSSIILQDLGKLTFISMNSMLYSVVELVILALKVKDACTIFKMNDNYGNVILELFDYKYETLDDLIDENNDYYEIDVEDEEFYVPKSLVLSNIDNEYRKYSIDFLDFAHIDVQHDNYLTEEEQQYLYDDEGNDADGGRIDEYQDDIQAVDFDDFNEDF